MITFQSMGSYTEIFVIETLNKGRQDGLDDGRQDGLDDGRHDGLDDGRHDGLDDGRHDGLDDGLVLFHWRHDVIKA